MLHFIFICGTLYYLNTTYNIKFYRYNSNVKKIFKIYKNTHLFNQYQTKSEFAVLNSNY